MTKDTVQKAIATIRALPKPVQNRISERVLADAERYSQLQRELEQSEKDIEDGKGISMAEVIITLKQRYGI